MIVISRFLKKLSDFASPRHLCVLACAAMLPVVSCGSPDTSKSAGAGPTARVATTAGVASSADSMARRSADSAAAMAAVRDTIAARKLTPAADSMTPYLVFVPTEERTLLAAVRNNRWLLDVGRMDLDVRKDSLKLRAFREAAQQTSPIPPRAVFRLWWTKGAEDVVADSFAVYNGRIVMRVFGSAALDSAARGKGAFAALAVRADSATAPMATTCELRVEPDSAARAALTALAPAEKKAQAAARKSADSAYDARVTAVRDSLEGELRKGPAPYARLQRKTRVVSSVVRGCFGAARRALVVSLRAGDAEWVRERFALIAPDGAVTMLRVNDLRFRAHDLLSAFDADGDGVDDLVVKGITERAGGTAILRVDLTKKRADRLVAGFAWETF